MAPGARNKFGTPMFDHKVSREEMYCSEECTCDIVGTFRDPPVMKRPARCVPLVTFLLTPLLQLQFLDMRV